MKTKPERMKTYFLALMCVFLWIGFICAISFMEAWLKFRAPGVTLPIGLGIGKLVFGALNKVEWFFVIALFLLLLKGVETSTLHRFLYGAMVLVLAIQTFWLLPALGVRADAHITGEAVLPNHYLHWFFIAGELIKVVVLTFFGLALFKTLSSTLQSAPAA